MDPLLARAWIAPGALGVLLKAWALAGGREPCGLLLGWREGDAARIARAIEASNVHPSPVAAFEIAADEHARIAREARSDGLEVVGFWHGHLTGPPRPGRRDAEGLAAAEDLAQGSLLLAIAGRGAGRTVVVRTWRRRHRRLHEIPLGCLRSGPSALAGSAAAPPT